jgi:hypothetical protein
MRSDSRAPDPMLCPRCENPLEYAGTRNFHEGARLGILGNLAELFVNRQSLDLYVCSRCGRIEFFIDGIGEEFRPH